MNVSKLNGALYFGVVGIAITFMMWGCPRYDVYSSSLKGQAELAQAQFNRQIKTQEAEATLEASKHLANAEIERAKGVSEANKIIGDGLKGHQEYLRYLWIMNMKTDGKEVIYIPTELNLPITEAGRAK